MLEKKKDKCEICGNELTYAITPDKYKDLICEFCGVQFNTNIYCKEDHYICDTCHSRGPIEIIEEVCLNTKLQDPFKLANKIMRHHKFKMYGPEHHVIVPAVILTSLRNNNIKKPSGEEISIFDIKEGIVRSSKIPGGWCGFYGSCGAGMGSGVTISIFTKATPSRDKERTLANQATSISLSKIADNLEHCCKRSVKWAICETLSFLKEKCNVHLDFAPLKCEFSNKNDKCEKINCVFYK